MQGNSDLNQICPFLPSSDIVYFTINNRSIVQIGRSTSTDFTLIFNSPEFGGIRIGITLPIPQDSIDVEDKTERCRLRIVLAIHLDCRRNVVEPLPAENVITNLLTLLLVLNLHATEESAASLVEKHRAVASIDRNRLIHSPFVKTCTGCQRKLEAAM